MEMCVSMQSDAIWNICYNYVCGDSMDSSNLQAEVSWLSPTVSSYMALNVMCIH